MSTSPVVADNFGWLISSLCDSGACVGVARLGNDVLIGNTSDPKAPVSRFTSQEWKAFVAGVKLGDFDELANLSGRVFGRGLARGSVSPQLFCRIKPTSLLIPSGNTASL